MALERLPPISAGALSQLRSRSAEAYVNDYWSERLQHALKSSHTAPSVEVRELHLQLASHYKALQSQCSRHAPFPGAEAASARTSDDPEGGR